MACHHAMDGRIGHSGVHLCPCALRRHAQQQHILRRSHRHKPGQVKSENRLHSQASADGISHADRRMYGILLPWSHECLRLGMPRTHHRVHRRLLHPLGQHSLLQFTLYRVCGVHIHAPLQSQLRTLLLCLNTPMVRDKDQRGDERLPQDCGRLRNTVRGIVPVHFAHFGERTHIASGTGGGIQMCTVPRIHHHKQHRVCRLQVRLCLMGQHISDAYHIPHDSRGMCRQHVGRHQSGKTDSMPESLAQ